MDAKIETCRIHDRVVAVLAGRKPDRIPFVDRLELWHKAHVRRGTLPQEYQGLSLTEIHRQVGMGQQKFVAAYAYRLRGVELSVSFQGELLAREKDPLVEYFPRMPGCAIQDRAGVTTLDLITPVGKLTMRYEMIPEMVQAGTEAYPKEHLIKDAADYATAEWVLERAEFVPRFEEVRQVEEELGEVGFAVPMLGRIPFQQLLLEYLGEVNTFYALHDQPNQVRRLLDLLHQRMQDALRQLAELQAPYVEFGDNLHGLMTNPKLFREYCLPHYQYYAEILHAQGKKMGSHTDGDMRPLLELLAESGLDVAESFSPLPLTSCSFEEAWRAWHDGPIIWGGIPSPMLEAETDEGEFRRFVDRILDTVNGRPIILGIGDQVLGNDLIERVKYIAERVEERVW